MNEHVPAPVDTLSPEQRADLARLLAEQLVPRNVQLLGERVLGAQAVADIIGNRPAPPMLAIQLVERMQHEGRLADAVSILRTETRNGNLLQGVNEILAGRRPEDLAGLQATLHAADDPFFSNDFIELYYPRVQRTVCAIALGDPVNGLRGTGFLIGPDLVLTNFHVIREFLEITGEGEEQSIRAKDGCNEIFCFFDYLSAPRPRVPPDDARPHSSTMVKALRNGWLIRARNRLDNEGIFPYATQAHKRFDYAIIKLEREIGKAPSRRSGGSMRGWLNLDSGVSFLDDVGSRIVVLQHPEGAEQLWDVGVYDKVDPSQTRIWYTVNTERGASGGPAVDRRGRLYALHNARVTNEDGSSTMNQGVRIDLIFEDLKTAPVVSLSPPTDDDPGYWSLSENLEDPRPIIGRQAFRETVQKMMTPTGDRLIQVVGVKDSGRHFSIDLLRRIVGTGVPVIRISPTDLRTLDPKAFVKVLAGELQLPNITSIPDPKPTEPVSRWLSNDLPAWLSQQLATDQARIPSRYPAWIVVDAAVLEGERVSWAENLNDLVSALMGPPDVAQVTPEIPQLRWLLLGSPNNVFPPSRHSPIVDDLSHATNTNFAQDFADCLSLGWRSIERAASIPPSLLKNMGSTFVNDAIRDNKIVRAYLAEYVRRFIRGQ
ncbi:trypsin-like serine peptidase [Bradyrhizobium sp. DASA03068]|uniref:trypsin-like serine peptidase n=1 Tax=Bradyrhizobium sp. BLXBL-01 TaxID=3395915 RepID=UPI003F7091AE